MDEYLKFLDEFREALALRYELNRHKKGDSWKDCPKRYLWDKFNEEVDEAQEVGVSPNAPLKNLQRELEDVALVAAMLWAREKEDWVKRVDDGLPDGFSPDPLKR